MKRKIIVLIAVTLLVIGNIMKNTYAYYTISSEYIGSVYNNRSMARIAYGRLYASGGVARLRICDPSGYVLASDIYPSYPVNTHNTETTCPSYTFRYFYVSSEDGNQAWGNHYYGLRDF